MEDPPVRFKICGVTRPRDAELALELGAWAVGLIFFPGSPRRCDPEAAAEVAAVVGRRAELVGVWVNAHLDTVAAQADALGLTAVQLHGDEGPAYCAEVARRTGTKVIKAFRMATVGDLAGLRRYRTTDLHLLDTGHPTLSGGTGEAWDWSMLERAPRGGPPRILSGGLTPDNVAEAIAAVRPYAVDVASGVEASPGIKDPDKLAAFAAAVRGEGLAAATVRRSEVVGG
jgi:phosphoribosylanthranilate isomerase